MTTTGNSILTSIAVLSASRYAGYAIHLSNGNPGKSCGFILNDVPPVRVCGFFSDVIRTHPSCGSPQDVSHQTTSMKVTGFGASTGLIWTTEFLGIVFNFLDPVLSLHKGVSALTSVCTPFLKTETYLSHTSASFLPAMKKEGATLLFIIRLVVETGQRGLGIDS